MRRGAGMSSLCLDFDNTWVHLVQQCQNRLDLKYLSNYAIKEMYLSKEEVKIRNYFLYFDD